MRSVSEKERHTHRNLIIVPKVCKIFVPARFMGWTVTDTPIMKCSRRGTETVCLWIFEFSTKPNTHEDAAIWLNHFPAFLPLVLRTRSIFYIPSNRVVFFRHLTHTLANTCQLTGRLIWQTNFKQTLSNHHGRYVCFTCAHITRSKSCTQRMYHLPMCTSIYAHIHTCNAR